MDVVNELKRINKVQPLQHSACISCIAIGENQPPPRQCTDIGVKFRIRRYALQRNVMNKVQKCVRISAVMMHQARERGPMLHEITLLRSEEHTSELQSLMRISYAVFCLNKKTK